MLHVESWVTWIMSRQVLACERGRIGLDEVFGPEAKGFIASLNTEGHHRGAVAAVKSQQLKEVHIPDFWASVHVAYCRVVFLSLSARLGSSVHACLRFFDMGVITGILPGGSEALY